MGVHLVCKIPLLARRTRPIAAQRDNRVTCIQGFTLIFVVVKLDFEKAVDQQTRARDQTFEGDPNSGCPRDSNAHIWSIFGIILPNHLNMHKTMLWDALLVAIYLLNIRISVLSKFDINLLSCEKNIICPYLSIHTNMIDFGT